MKKYQKISTKKLQELLTKDSTPAAEKALIQKELDSRQPKEEPQVEGTQVEGTQKEEPQTEEAQEKSIEDQKAEMDLMIGHKVTFLPFNEMTLDNGVITGVVVDEKGKKTRLLYRVRSLSTNKSKPILPTAKFFTILDEKMDISSKPKSEKEFEDEESMLEAANEMKNTLVGHIVTYPTGKTNEDGSEVIGTGVVIGIVPEKRVLSILVKIKSDDKIIHKVYKYVTPTGEVDSKVREAFEARAASTKRTPQEEFEYLLGKISATKEKIQSMTTKVEEMTAKVEALKKELSKEESKSLDGEETQVGRQGEETQE